MCSLAVEFIRIMMPSPSLAGKLGDLNRLVVLQEELVVVLNDINQNLSVIPGTTFTLESSRSHHLAVCSFEMCMRYQ